MSVRFFRFAEKPSEPAILSREIFSASIVVHHCGPEKGRENSRCIVNPLAAHFQASVTLAQAESRPFEHCGDRPPSSAAMTAAYLHHREAPG